jgi:hypothetical protein
MVARLTLSGAERELELPRPALEHARMLDELRREIALRRDAEETLRSLVRGTAAVTGSDFFRSLVSHLAAALRVPFALAAACRTPEKRARTLAFWRDDRLVENVSDGREQMPCQSLLGHQVCHHRERVAQLFPEEGALAELGAESYLGVPVRARSGVVIGHLAVLDREPMEVPRGLPLLEVFAPRAGAELEREEAEHELRRALDGAERLQARLQAENAHLREELRREHPLDELEPAAVLTPGLPPGLGGEVWALAARAPMLSEPGTPTAHATPGASDALDDVQRRHIVSVLERCGGRIEGPRGAAKLLGLHPNTLRSRLAKLGIRRRS